MNSKAAAMIFQSGVLRTNLSNVIRPSPSHFYMPGLQAKSVWDSSKFDWIKDLESNVDVIRKEYESMSKLKESDYVTSSDEHTLHNGKWNWHSYVLKGNRQSSFALHCPKTVELIENVPSLMTNLPIAYCFFSSLQSNTTISPHSGICNLRLRVHLPLIVPKGDIGMRVGNDIIKWEEGKAVVFDDSYEHEVYNNTDKERVLLLFDIWHPDLAQEEIDCIKEMFSSHKKSNSTANNNTNNINASQASSL